MKIKITTVDLELSARAKRALALLTVPTVVVLGLAALAHAGVPNALNAGEPLSATKLNANFTALDQRLAAIEAASGSVPPGTIVAYGGTTPPVGWLPCDGTVLDSTNATYAALYQAIGVTWGGNATSFRLPDLRGRFLRGWDHGAGVDPDAGARVASADGGDTGDHVGTSELDANRSHAHGVVDPGHAHGSYQFQVDGSSVGGHIQGGHDTPFTVWYNYSNGGGSTTGVSIAADGGSESRPVNSAVQFLIKL